MTKARAIELEEPILRLGREKGSTIHLHDTEVSRQHAELRRTHRDYTISDLNSSNGTFVNGKRVQQHLLASGDQVQAGATLMLYTGPSDESDGDVGSSVDIASAAAADDQSRIIHSVTQKEGSRIFDTQADLPQNSWLARARSNLQVMYRTALAVSHTLDIDQLLNRIMELIFEWVEADRGCIMLFDPDSQQLDPRVRRTRNTAQRGDKITISKTILDFVVQRGEGVLTSDARQDDRFSPGASIVKLGVREAICVPMQGRYHVVGVIYIDTSTSPQQSIEQGGAVAALHRRPSQTDDRHRPSGGPGGGRYPLLLGHGPGRAAGRHRPDHRHALAPHQEHPPGHPRRKLPYRDGA